MNLDLPSLLGGVPAWTPAAGVALLTGVLVGAALTALTARRRPALAAGVDHRPETALTVAAAGIATALSATGMWRVVSDALHLPGWLQVGVFAFVEIAIVTSAIRARRTLIDTGSTGVDGTAVWVLAAVSGALSALDARHPVEVLLRLAAPMVAAWLWERGLAPQRRHARARRHDRGITWRASRQRLPVWLRLAEPAARELGEIDRSRRIAGLVRAACRHHLLVEAGARPGRVARSAARLRRQAASAARYAGLGTDPAVTDRVRTTLATLYGVTAGTAPDAVADLAVWGPAHPQHAPRTNGHQPAAPAGAGPTTVVRDGPDPIANRNPNPAAPAGAAVWSGLFAQISDASSGSPDPLESHRQTVPPAAAHDRPLVVQAGPPPSSNGHRIRDRAAAHGPTPTVLEFRGPPLPHLPDLATSTKADAIRAALSATGGDIEATLNLLTAQGIPTQRHYVRRLARRPHPTNQKPATTPTNQT